MAISVRSFTGATAREYKKDLARLRIAVFREYPYLYDGTLAYEEKYLDTFMQAPENIIVVAFDGDQVVGVSTGIPMKNEPEAISKAWEAAGYEIDKIFYLSESVLLKTYRGRGIGGRFFEERERWARSLHYETATFCGVIRPHDHPAKPADFIPLDAFWQKRGYERKDGFTCTMSWKEVGEMEESGKELQFWSKLLSQHQD
ncbi:MAG: GNAT family N-acetyltransferase [Saprospiraceae bacterium]|nr:GNAT family N-acetyltransferase [Lewinella sp.]